MKLSNLKISHIVFAIALVILFCDSVNAAESIYNVSGQEGLAKIENVTTEPSYLLVQCGNGWIRISMKTGNVEFLNCNPDEASKALWLGLKPYFDTWKDEICKEKSK